MLSQTGYEAQRLDPILQKKIVLIAIHSLKNVQTIDKQQKL